jgi:hypothetical protein
VGPYWQRLIETAALAERGSLTASAPADLRVISSKAKDEIIEIVDRSTGAKLVMLEDGRTG